MRGRKPKPTTLKVVQGNPGKRALNKDEPQIVEALRHAPDWFNDDQREIWRYAIHHAPEGVLGTIDRELLAMWCVACDTYRMAVEMQAKFDSLTEAKLAVKTPNGMLVQSPYIGIMNSQARTMIKAAAEMGFTPASRTRISVKGREITDNPFDEF